MDNFDTNWRNHMNRIMNFLKNEDGLELSEYAVAAALIAVACVLAFQGLSGGISDAIGGLTDTITGAGN